MRIVYAPTATDEIKVIWLYNVERYGIEHANDYRAFLRERIGALATEHSYGQPVEGRTGLQYISLRKSAQCHGHIAIYRGDEANNMIRILHVFHTAQDWQSRLQREQR